MKINKLTLWSIMKPALWPLAALFFIVILFFPVLGFFSNDKEGFLIFIIFAGAFLASATIVPLVLNINYLINDFGSQLIYDEPNQRIDYISNKKRESFNVTDIKKIRKFQYKAVDGEGIPFVPWSGYYYYIIYYGEVEKIYVSRMIIEKLEMKIESADFDLTKRVFPLILKEKASYKVADR